MKTLLFACGLLLAGSLPSWAQRGRPAPDNAAYAPAINRQRGGGYDRQRGEGYDRQRGEGHDRQRAGRPAIQLDPQNRRSRPAGRQRQDQPHYSRERL